MRNIHRLLEPLTPEEIEKSLTTLKKWELFEGTTLNKYFMFKNFAETFSFVTRVACLAEKLNHHPHIFITENSASIYMKTYSKKTITRLDIKFARTLDRWYERTEYSSY